ncbi:MAG: isoprenyl synthetase [Crocinitomicaceae bacterium]|nr:isoprenyl synthetase [Crocinitomicaceae bacterium]
MHSINELQKHFENALGLVEFSDRPTELYDPVDYILKLKGKRARPVCTLASCEMFGGNYKAAINQAIAVEIFHNFTLVHDDIMDQAPLRRGKETVHKKWDTNTGILSGDAMMILAYQYLQKASNDKIQSLLSSFNRTAIKVCEGQQWDMNFETSTNVSMDDYLSMIKQKTAVLLGEALRLGAIMANADEESQHLIYDFGKDFGIAFQIQDDILDLYGDPEKFGKSPGGDILAGKKSYLYVKAMERAPKMLKEELNQTYYSADLKAPQKIEKVKSIFDELDIKSRAKAEMNRYYLSAGIALNTIEIPENQKLVLKEFAEGLMVREI